LNVMMVHQKSTQWQNPAKLLNFAIS